MKIVELKCSFKECNIDELQAEDKRLIEEANKAAKSAYAPYSKFYVGAAVLLENGKIIQGNNQENASYPLGLCAERVAIFSAAANHLGVKINAIAVTASSNELQINKPVTPCGACRQAIAEYEYRYKNPIRIIMAGQNGSVLIAESIKEFLPYQFTSDDLKAK